MKKFKSDVKNQSGQVILLIVMLVAVVTTVALTLSFRTQTDTQLGKLNVETGALREAAEGGVELGFTYPGNTVQTYAQLGYSNSLTPTPGRTMLPGVDVERSRIIVSNNSSDPSLVTQSLNNNGMFTFYLVPVTDIQAMTFEETSFPGDLDVFYNDQGVRNCRDISLEFTIIADTAAGAATTFVVKPRYISDAGNDLNSNVNDVYQTGGSTSLPIVAGGPTTSFRCRARLPLASLATGRVLFVRVLTLTAGRITRLGFRANPIVPLTVQKRSVRSEVWSTDGLLSITVADQSYPQLPTDFFVTSF